MANAEMDQAAELARMELVANIRKWSALDVADWWQRHYLKAGHRRLGRVLVQVRKQLQAETDAAGGAT